MTAVALVLADTWDDHMGVGGWIMMIGMLLFWALLVVGVVWLVRSSSGWSPGEPRQEAPLNVLARRFAEGEISAEEYRERRAVLRGDDTRP